VLRARVRHRLGNLSVTGQTGRTTRAGCGAGAKACREGLQDATPALVLLGVRGRESVCGQTLGGGAAVTCTGHGFELPWRFDTDEKAQGEGDNSTLGRKAYKATLVFLIHAPSPKSPSQQWWHGNAGG
jgi:hypothetical protein